jgi:hypothetical protein
MEEHRFTISFEGANPAEASEYAAGLRNAILDEEPGAQVTRQPTPGAQDLGMALQVVVASPAVILLARALIKWVESRRSSSVTIKKGTTTITVTNVSDGKALDVVALAEKLVS